MEGIGKLASKPKHSTKGKSEGLLCVCEVLYCCNLLSETWGLMERLEGLLASLIMECRDTCQE